MSTVRLALALLTFVTAFSLSLQAGEQSALRSFQNASQETDRAKAEVAKESQELASDQAKLTQPQSQLGKAKLNDVMRRPSPVIVTRPPKKK